MVVDIQYPADESVWYAKGTFSTGSYFEVPAVFNADGTCDVPATDIKVQQFAGIVSQLEGN